MVRAYLTTVMNKEISKSVAKFLENWNWTNTNHFTDWTVTSYSVPPHNRNKVVELAKHLGCEYKMTYCGRLDY